MNLYIQLQSNYLANNANQKTGYHATTTETFAAAFHTALTLPPQQVLALRKRAQASAARFSEEVFAKGWLEAMEELVEMVPPRKKFF